MLNNIRGIVHVGASYGQEAVEYKLNHLSVLWIEPIPESFLRLQKEILPYAKQKAVNGLCTDQVGTEYKLNIASNDGLSSSIYELGQHAEIWKDIKYVDTLSIRSTTVDKIMETQDRSLYDAMVVDTQGADLLVLQGAIKTIDKMKYIKVEVADFELYLGGCRLRDIEMFMWDHGFVEYRREFFAAHNDGGICWDIIYKNKKHNNLITAFLTSIPEIYTQDHQQAIASWQRYGKVYSVNTASEIDNLKNDYPDVVFCAAPKPKDSFGVRDTVRITDMLDIAKNIDCDIICLLNSDIYINGDYTELEKRYSGGLIYCQRNNCEKNYTNATLELGGIDIFIFNRKYATIFKPNQTFKIGKPWWDYWFPCKFLTKGIPVCKYIGNVFYHISHERNWDMKQWVNNVEPFLCEYPRYRAIDKIRDVQKYGSMIKKIIDEGSKQII